MGAFLSGLLGAAGQDIDKQEQRRYDEKRQERMDRMKILELAMSNPHLDQNQLDPLFKELQGIADDSHYKSENKGIKDPFLQMLKPVKYIFGRQKQKQQQQQAQQQYRADVQNAPGVTAQPQMTGPGAEAYEAKTWGGPGARPQQPMQVPQRGQARQTPPMPQSRFRTREQDKAEAEEEFQTGLKHEGVSSKAKTQQQLEKVEQLKQYFIDKEHLDEKTASEEANLAVFGSALKKPGGSKLTKEWITRPGSEDPEHVWVDPSGGFIDMNTGDPIPKEGVKTSGPPTRERLMQAIQGYYYHYKKLGYSHADALGLAGDDFRDYQGKHLSRLEQQMRMDEFKSSIGPGKGFSQPNTPAPAARPTAQPGAPPVPQPVQPGNVPRGTLAMPPPRIARPAAPAGPSAATAPLRSTLNPQELENADYFIGTLTGAQKGTGNAAIRTQLGQRAAAKVGLTPEVLTARAERRKATAKAIDKITLMTDSVDGLEKALARHGAVLNTLRPQLPDTDVKRLNELLKTAALEFNLKGLSEPAVRYGLAMQAVRNEYGRVIAGGASSAGQTHVEALKEAGEKMSEGFTSGNTRAMIDQIGIETQQRGGGYREKLKEMQDEMSQPLAPELRGGKYKEIQQTPPPGGGSRIKIINVEPA